MRECFLTPNAAGHPFLNAYGYRMDWSTLVYALDILWNSRNTTFRNLGGFSRMSYMPLLFRESKKNQELVAYTMIHRRLEPFSLVWIFCEKCPANFRVYVRMFTQFEKWKHWGNTHCIVLHKFLGGSFLEAPKMFDYPCGKHVHFQFKSCYMNFVLNYNVPLKSSIFSLC